MTTADLKIVHQFIDKALAAFEDTPMMMTPDDVPEVMYDNTREEEDDWKPWKAIPSTVTEDDIKEIESWIKRPLPESFIAFLQYKHFYEIYGDKGDEISFYEHPIGTWKGMYQDMYTHDVIQEGLLNNGYIPFGNYSDWGLLCFDAKKEVMGNEYPVVMVDHEILGDKANYKPLYQSFIDLLKDNMHE